MAGENVLCYTAACPECGEVLGVTVADPTRPSTMQNALNDRSEWERDGMTLGTCTVGEVRSGKFQFDHVAGCTQRIEQAELDLTEAK